MCLELGSPSPRGKMEKIAMMRAWTMKARLKRRCTRGELTKS